MSCLKRSVLFLVMACLVVISPFRAGVVKASQQQMDQKTGGETVSLVILGGNGDLALRKLFPSLFRLYSGGNLPKYFHITGVSLADISEQSYIQDIKEFSPQAYPGDEQSGIQSRQFFEGIRYVQVDLKKADEFKKLKGVLEGIKGPRQDVFYFALSSHLYIDTIKNMAKSGLINGNSRFIFEKPVGYDAFSGEEILSTIKNFLNENQIYLIDHYLSKEMVQNIFALRFANRIFSELWSREHISHVEITVSEKLGLENRAAYYDRFGCLRDMIQSHLLQILALMAMEPPAEASFESVSAEKVRLLKSLKPLKGEDIPEKVVLGRYTGGLIDGKTVPSYLDEPGVDAEQNTETFVALKAEIENSRWSGVPFFLRTGKRMKDRYALVVVHFRKTPHAHLFSTDKIADNQLVITIQPEAGLALKLNYKEDSLKRKIRNKTLRTEPDSLKTGLMPEAYEKLLYYALQGQKEYFIDPGEVLAAWTYVDPIVQYFKNQPEAPAPYPAGTLGPLASFGLLEKSGFSWYLPEDSGGKK